MPVGGGSARPPIDVDAIYNEFLSRTPFAQLLCGFFAKIGLSERIPNHIQESVYVCLTLPIQRCVVLLHKGSSLPAKHAIVWQFGLFDTCHSEDVLYLPQYKMGDTELAKVSS